MNSATEAQSNNSRGATSQGTAEMESGETLKAAAEPGGSCLQALGAFPVALALLRDAEAVP